MEFLLNSVYYLYNYYIVCALLSHTHHVTHHVMSPCDLLTCDIYYVTLSYTSSLCSKSKRKRKKKKYK